MAYQLPHVVQTEQGRHQKHICLFDKCNNAKHELQQQLVKTIDNSYFTALRNG